MFTRDELKEQLISDVRMVTFTKTDGTERVMRCTLNENYLPPKDDKDNKLTREPNNEVLPVWDLDKNAWRSFRIDSVKNIEIYGE